MHKIIRFQLLFALLPVIATMSGCVETKPNQDAKPKERVELVFPSPPDEPRFYYELTLFHTGQFTRQSKESRWRELLTGEKIAGGGTALIKPYSVTTCGGRVYISDTTQRLLTVFDFQNGGGFTIGTKEPGLLRKPLGIDSDENCRIYVTDITLGKVLIYDADGNYLTAIGKSDQFHRLSHVAVDPAGTRLFAVDTGGVSTDEHRVRAFDIQSGDHLFDIGKRGKGEGELNLPKDIAFVNGLLYVVDSGNFRVQVFDQDGKFIRAFGEAGSRFGQFSRPKGIASDADGNVYVADAAFGNFQIFNSEGQLLMFVGSRTNESQPAGYMLPSGIDVDSDGRIYFVDQFYHKVDVFRPAGLQPGDGYLGRYLHTGS